MHSRLFTLVTLVLTLALLIAADARPLAVPVRKGPERLNNVNPAAATTDGKNVPVGGEDVSSNYVSFQFCLLLHWW